MRPALADGWNEIEAFRDEWLDLCQQAFNSTPFADPDFCRLWLKHRAPSALPRIVVLRDDSGEPEALAPLCIVAAKKAGLTIKRLRFMVAVSWLDSDFLLTRRGMDGVPALLSAATANRDFDMLDLFAMPSSSASLRGIEEFGAEAGYSPEHLRPPRWTNSLVSLDGTWKNYLARRSPRTRYILRRVERKMEKSGKVEIKRWAGGPEGLDEYLKAVESIVSRSWKDPSGYREGGFWREFIDVMSRKGSLRLYVLRVDDHPASFIVLLRHRRTIYWMQTGYDLEYARLSPGTYLIARVIRDCFEDKGSQTRMDFLTSYPFLERLADSAGARLRVRCFPSGLKGRMLSLGFRLAGIWARRDTGRRRLRPAAPEGWRGGIGEKTTSEKPPETAEALELERAEERP